LQAYLSFPREPLSVLHKALIHSIVLRVLVFHKFYGTGVEAVDVGPGACHEDGRVGSDNELRMSRLGHIPEKGKEFQLGLGGAVSGSSRR